MTEATFFDDIAPLPRRGGSRAAAQEQQGGALRAAGRRRRARAGGGARSRARTAPFPRRSERDASVQQAATLAANLAAQPDRWPEFRARLHAARRADREVARPRGARARLVREVALELATVARAATRSRLALAVALDLAIGDPVYRAHPVRLIGRTLQAIRARPAALGADGYGGGIALFVAARRSCGSATLSGVVLAGASRGRAGRVGRFTCFLLYSLLALGDLLHHGGGIERALGRGDLVAHASARLAAGRPRHRSRWTPPPAGAPRSRA